MHQTPGHLRLRNVDGSFTDRDEQEWPLARTKWTKYYLHPDVYVTLRVLDLVGKDVTFVSANGYHGLILFGIC